MSKLRVNAELVVMECLEWECPYCKHWNETYMGDPNDLTGYTPKEGEEIEENCEECKREVALKVVYD